MIVAVDPGVHMSGVALFSDDHVLNNAKWWPSDQVRFRLGCPLYIEVPRIYPGSNSKKGDLNDLLDLSLMAGRIIGANSPVTTIFPAEWKRQVPKDVMVERIKSFLTPEERLRVELPTAKSKHHNVWDAVGIGLYAVGRMKPGGVK